MDKLFLDNLNVNDFDVFLRFLLVCSHVLDSVNHVHSLVGTAEYCMLIVKPWLFIVSGCTMYIDWLDSPSFLS